MHQSKMQGVSKRQPAVNERAAEELAAPKPGSLQNLAAVPQTTRRKGAD